MQQIKVAEAIPLIPVNINYSILLSSSYHHNSLLSNTCWDTSLNKNHVGTHTFAYLKNKRYLIHFLFYFLILMYVSPSPFLFGFVTNQVML
jgi:hypothetical protein